MESRNDGLKPAEFMKLGEHRREVRASDREPVPKIHRPALATWPAAITTDGIAGRLLVSSRDESGRREGLPSNSGVLATCRLRRQKANIGSDRSLMFTAIFSSGRRLRSRLTASGGPTGMRIRRVAACGGPRNPVVVTFGLPAGGWLRSKAALGKVRAGRL